MFPKDLQLKTSTTTFALPKIDRHALKTFVIDKDLAFFTILAALLYFQSNKKFC